MGNCYSVRGDRFVVRYSIIYIGKRECFSHRFFRDKTNRQRRTRPFADPREQVLLIFSCVCRVKCTVYF